MKVVTASLAGLWLTETDALLTELSTDLPPALPSDLALLALGLVAVPGAAVPRFDTVTIDCPDPAALARFYGDLFEWPDFASVAIAAVVGLAWRSRDRRFVAAFAG